MMEKLADAILKHSKLIVILWIVLLLVSTPFMYKVLVDPQGVLTYEMTEMKGDESESHDGMMILKNRTYFDGSNTDYVIVFCFDNTTEEDKISAMYLQLIPIVSKHYNDSKEVSVIMAGTNLEDIRLVTVNIPKEASKNEGVEFLRNTVNELKNSKEIQYHNNTYVTGNYALTYDVSRAAMDDVKKIDPFSILLVLILIGLFFRSLISAATPPLTIGFAYGIVMIVICGISLFTDIFYITSTLVLISMLGAGCDYCIFIIARYREERKAGKDQDSALKEAVMWAGESVAVSGLCVIIGFGVMSLCSFSLIQTMGIVLASGIIFALLAALTLIPSIIHLVGDKIFYPTKVEYYIESEKNESGWYSKIGKLGKSYFRSSAKFSINHAWAVIVAAIVITAPLTYVALTEKTSFDMISTMPQTEAKDGIDIITHSGMGGITMPTFILLDVGKDFATIDESGTFGTLTWDTSTTQKQQNLLNLVQGTTYSKGGTASGLAKYIVDHDGDNKNISKMIGIFSWNIAVVAAGGNESVAIDYIRNYVSSEVAEGIETIKTLTGTEYPNDVPYIDYALNVTSFGSVSYSKDTQYIKITLLYCDQPMSDVSMSSAAAIRAATHEYKDSEEGKAIGIKATYTTGTTPVLDDISNTVKADFKIIEIVVVILILLLLMLVMKSYLTPVRSVVTIIMSIMWTLGVTHIVFGWTLAQPIIWMIPIVLFVICLGLGMDYDVLLTTRIKEYVGKGMDTDEAIAAAVEHSGAIITICGLIMGGAFMSMILSTTPMLQQFGFALGFAILIDALVIRTYVVPAAMHLLGKWNWIGPKFLSKKTE